MRGTADAIKLSGQDAGTYGPYALEGGTYAVTMVSSGWNSGSGDVQIQGPDGATYVSVLAAAFSANGYKTFQVPPCLVEVVLTSTTAGDTSFSICRVPSE